MAEIWDLVDINKNKTGITWERSNEASIPDGMYHICTVIWTVSPDGKILLTKRHPSKICGLMWENSGGCLVSGENGREGARRELFEETGILADESDLIYLGDTAEDRRIVETYVYRLSDINTELSLQQTEVVGAKWVSSDELESMKNDIVPVIYEKFVKYKDLITK